MKNLGFLGLPHHCVTEKGEVYSLRSNRFLKPNQNEKGYLRINLWDGEKSVYFYIHRLVAMAYYPNEDHNLQVNHIDGNKLNNYFKNLEFVTLQDNISHSVDNGLRDSQKYYTDDQIHHVCRLLENGLRNKDIESMTGVPTAKITMIRQGLAYQYISSEYQIPFVPKPRRLSVDKIIRVCELLQEGYQPRQIHKLLGIGYQTVRYIKRRETHTDISKNFKW